MPKVVIVGSYAVGLVMTANSVPRPGETVLGDSFEETHGGKGSNQAVAASRLGADVSFIGRIGKDHYGRDALELHKNEGVDVELLTETEEFYTGAGFIIVDRKGENSIVVTPGANSALDEEFIDGARDKISNADVVLTQLEIPLEAALYSGELASNFGVTSILNPAPAPESSIKPSKLSNFDLVTPNYTEACALADLDPESNPDPEVILKILADKGANSVIMTLGSDGAFLKSEDRQIKIDAPDVETVDTTGAGDVFNAAVAVALAEGKSLNSGEIIDFACNAGALAVTKNNVIPSIPTRDELEEFTSKSSRGDGNEEG